MNERLETLKEVLKYANKIKHQTEERTGFAEIPVDLVCSYLEFEIAKIEGEID